MKPPVFDARLHIQAVQRQLERIGILRYGEHRGWTLYRNGRNTEFWGEHVQAGAVHETPHLSSRLDVTRYIDEALGGPAS